MTWWSWWYDCGAKSTLRRLLYIIATLPLSQRNVAIITVNQSAFIKDSLDVNAHIRISEHGVSADFCWSRWLTLTWLVGRLIGWVRFILACTIHSRKFRYSSIPAYSIELDQTHNSRYHHTTNILLSINHWFIYHQNRCSMFCLMIELWMANQTSANKVQSRTKSLLMRFINQSQLVLPFCSWCS